MADLPKVKMYKPPVTKCIYNVPWVGSCNKQTAEGHEVCEEHLKYKCHCGKQATGGCSSAGSLVCGRPTCNDCKCPTHGY